MKTNRPNSIPYISSASSDSGRESFVLIEGKQGLGFEETVKDLMSNLEKHLIKNNLSIKDIVRLRIYLTDIANQQSIMREIISRYELTAHYFMIEQAPTSGTKVAMEAYLMKSKTLKKYQISDNGIRVLHGKYESLWIRSSPSPVSSINKQAKQLFSMLEQDLKKFGATIKKNTLRTWIYIRDIDNNYKIFCDVRSKYFADIGLTANTHFIASTGIEGATEKALRYFSMDSHAVKGIDPRQVNYIRAKKHLCPTSEYTTRRAYGTVGRNVTFERGTQVTYGDRRHIYISGTASIDKDGNILYQKDVIKQTKRSIENIQALLGRCNLTIEDMRYLIIYLRDIADHQLVKEYLDNSLPKDLPFLMVQGRICNPSWLIEIDGFGICIEKTSAYNDYF